MFERHTEWISKGKAGTPVELGLRVCVLQDQFGFTLHHLVMEKREVMTPKALVTGVVSADEAED